MSHSDFNDSYYHGISADWENHAHASTHDASLTIKTFALSSIVAYLGLSLSAFVYVPFGEYIMATVHTFMLKEAIKPDENKADAKAHEKAAEVEPLVADTSAIASKINGSRLQNQMFAYTVTNQIINTFLEVGLPFILRGVGNVRSGKGLKLHNTPATDDKLGDAAFLEDIKLQASLPQYSLFSEWISPALVSYLNLCSGLLGNGDAVWIRCVVLHHMATCTSHGVTEQLA